MTDLNIQNSDIVRVELRGEDTLIYARDGSSVLAINTIDELEKDLGKDSFIRIHPCHLINKDYFSQVEEVSSYHVTLNNGVQLPADKRLVSKKKWLNFKREKR